MTESENATIDHIRRVQQLLHDVAARLIERARVHDTSKVAEPEASIFETYTAKLKGCTYGSDEYKQYLAEMKPALDHHYAKNSHHPEHWKNGVRDMSLLDLIEMLVDWKAAGERHADGSMDESLAKNQSRFGYSDELAWILKATAAELWPKSAVTWHCLSCGAGGNDHNFCSQCGSREWTADDFKAKEPSP